MGPILAIQQLQLEKTLDVTRSYAALRAADLDWIVGKGYSWGGYILGCSQRLASCLWHSAQTDILLSTFFVLFLDDIMLRRENLPPDVENLPPDIENFPPDVENLPPDVENLSPDVKISSQTLKILPRRENLPPDVKVSPKTLKISPQA